MNTKIKVRVKVPEEINVELKDLAYGLAMAFDNEQAVFLNEFAKNLKTVCETEHHFEIQIHSIANSIQLHEAGKQLIKDLYKMLDATKKIINDDINKPNNSGLGMP